MKTRRRRLSASLIFVLCAVLSFAQQSAPAKIDDLRPTLLFISIDGFRADYLNTAPSPNLHKLAETGVTGSMYPVFPSLTFPNHYSIATGLYPAHHGIVSNVFRDPAYPVEVFKYSDDAIKSESHWWLGEPIWVTGEKQNQHAAILYWPGSDTEIEGIRPTRWEHFKPNADPEENVAKLLSEFDVPSAGRSTIFGVYFEPVDHAGHVFGPASEELRQSVARVDAAIGTLLDGLARRGIADKVNIVIVSDHGMTKLSRDRVVFLDDYVDPDKIDVAYSGPSFGFYPRELTANEVASRLGHIPHAKLFSLSTAPKRFHYSGSDRLTPYFLLLDDEWSITTHKKFDADPKFATGGAHGYDPKLESMRALFIAHGPAFKSGAKMPPFENINLYSLFAHLQGLQPAKNDGKWNIFRQVLNESARAGKAASAD